MLQLRAPGAGEVFQTSGVGQADVRLRRPLTPGALRRIIARCARRRRTKRRPCCSSEELRIAD
eukprot:9704350-Alexandrium_andersonii.AAC.1